MRQDLHQQKKKQEHEVYSFLIDKIEHIGEGGGRERGKENGVRDPAVHMKIDI